MSVTPPVDPAASPEESECIDSLIAIMAALRTPVTGCPWDLEQSFATIAPYTIEEAYEVADAIQRHDLGDLRDELGDLLLQVVYHARLAEEEGAFAFGDVVRAITRKMIRRHPHVFGDAAARSAGAAKGFWERIKAEEKAERIARGGMEPAGLLADVPRALPALTRTVKLQAKAATVGFDWPSLGPVMAKMREELGELEEAAISADPRGNAAAAPLDEAARAHIAEEYGDLLFVMANVARHLSIDPEAALRAANEKFTRRFRRIEQGLAAEGRSPSEATLAEMDRHWDAAKAEERAGEREG